MNDSPVLIESRILSVLIDPGRGSDVLSLVHKASGVELLFATPWRERADEIREGRSAVTSTGSMETWLEQYRGGWQTLCPNAGAPRSVGGAPFGYHGEASVTSWRVVDRRTDGLTLRTSLFSVPVSIEREIDVEDGVLRITDSLTNMSSRRIRFDYAHHPAFGGAFLGEGCTIATGAATFINDFEAGIAGVEPDSRHAWPFAAGADGATTDLSVVTRDDAGRSVFGWLTDFAGHWASVTAGELGLTARLEWDGTHLPYAWLWQELGSTADWPWYGRARAVAIEPSSTPTSGPRRQSFLTLDPEARIRIPISLTVSEDNVSEDNGDV